MGTTADGSFAGKVAFVTGAANGIGRATALAFAGEREGGGGWGGHRHAADRGE